MQRTINIVIFLIVWAIGAADAAADEVRKLATEPRRASDVGSELSPARLDFFFGDIRAWLLQDGNWHIEGNIQHRGALCGRYELGIQFGIGSPGCSNVEWMGSPAYVTIRTHCNNALLSHAGSDVDHVAAEAFDRINCAQRLIRCSGTCK
ncbi:MAG: hypothetical protein JSW48_14110 [Betaproteobacteria bacterium]|jgi:hypothetical protein|nr:MAG: hypothetical protein JSW48_14110 [Betaproteobacteria bacterium]